MRHPNCTFLKRLIPLCLLVMAMLPATRLLAGGGFLHINIDPELLWYSHAAHSNTSPNSEPDWVPTLPVGFSLADADSATFLEYVAYNSAFAAECAIHHTSAPHLCDNQLYTNLWNPSQLDNVADNIATGNQLPTLIYEEIKVRFDQGPNSFVDEDQGNVDAEVWLDEIEGLNAEDLPQVNDVSIVTLEEIEAFAVEETMPSNTVSPQQPYLQTNILHVNWMKNIPYPGRYNDLEAMPRNENPPQQVQILVDNINPYDNIADHVPAISLDEEWVDNVEDMDATTVEVVAEEDNKQIDQAAMPQLQLSAWPNPSTGRFSVRLNGSVGTTVTFQVLSVDGKVIRIQSTDQETVAFDISEQSAGTYFVKATAADGRAYATSLILQH